MSTVNSKIAAIYTNLGWMLIFSFWAVPAHSWEVDFSRRQLQFSQVQDESRLPASVSAPKTMVATDTKYSDAKSNVGSGVLGPLAEAFEGTEPTKDIVILNTGQGFIPEVLNLKQGQTYRIHVVNVSEKNKNISFIMDSFDQHHNTVFGQERAFVLTPKADGVFSYVCPELDLQGKVVVMSSERSPASQK